MDPDAVVDAIELDKGEERYGNAITEWRPVKFKNGFEEMKYFHNRQMVVRNCYWLYGELGIAAFVGILAFFLVPKWRKTLDARYEPPAIVIGGALLGGLSVIIVPFILRFLLPAPVRWFPREVIAISDLREKELTESLRRVGSELDAERMPLDE